MKRQLWVLVAGLALALGGCAVASEEPGEEATDQQSAELGAESAAGGPSVGGVGSEALGRPRDLVSASSGDPSGPTPYPWATSDDPSGGPTPYPWEGEPDPADETNDSTQTSGSSTSGSGATQQKTTSTHH